MPPVFYKVGTLSRELYFVLPITMPEGACTCFTSRLPCGSNALPPTAPVNARLFHRSCGGLTWTQGHLRNLMGLLFKMSMHEQPSLITVYSKRNMWDFRSRKYGMIMMNILVEGSSNFDQLVFFNVHSHGTVDGPLPFRLHQNATTVAAITLATFGLVDEHPSHCST